MIKFHGLKIKKLTKEEILQQLQKDIQATIDMNKKMKNGTWIHKNEIDALK